MPIIYQAEKLVRISTIMKKYMSTVIEITS